MCDHGLVEKSGCKLPFFYNKKKKGIKHKKFKIFTIPVILGGAVGFLSSYNLFISPPVMFLLENSNYYGITIKETPGLGCVVQAACCIGAIAGAPLLGVLSDFFGHKSAIILSVGIQIIGALLTALGCWGTALERIILLLFSRIIIGVGVGGSFALMYVVSVEDIQKKNNNLNEESQESLEDKNQKNSEILSIDEPSTDSSSVSNEDIVSLSVINLAKKNISKVNPITVKKLPSSDYDLVQTNEERQKNYKSLLRCSTTGLISFPGSALPSVVLYIFWLAFNDVELTWRATSGLSILGSLILIVLLYYYLIDNKLTSYTNTTTLDNEDETPSCIMSIERETVVVEKNQINTELSSETDQNNIAISLPTNVHTPIEMKSSVFRLNFIERENFFRLIGTLGCSFCSGFIYCGLSTIYPSLIHDMAHRKTTTTQDVSGLKSITLFNSIIFLLCTPAPAIAVYLLNFISCRVILLGTSLIKITILLLLVLIPCCNPFYITGMLTMCMFSQLVGFGTYAPLLATVIFPPKCRATMSGISGVGRWAGSTLGILIFVELMRVGGAHLTLWVAILTSVIMLILAWLFIFPNAQPRAPLWVLKISGYYP